MQYMQVNIIMLYGSEEPFNVSIIRCPPFAIHRYADGL